jgi:hypothetical protein
MEISRGKRGIGIIRDITVIGDCGAGIFCHRSLNRKRLGMEGLVVEVLHEFMLRDKVCFP